MEAPYYIMKAEKSRRTLFSAAFTFAIQDLKISWRWYRAAYEKELKNEKGNGG